MQRTRWLFLKGLAAVYAIAFLSFWVQADALVGPHGIWPAAEWLLQVKASLGGRAWLEVPTLCLGGVGPKLACALGTLLAFALWAGLAPRVSLVGLWVLYLSVQTAGSIFMSYQWDLLLLEVGLLAIPLAPAGLFPRHPAPPSALSVWLLRWLLFRLMFMSGVVKLHSGDATWRDLTALRYHYWTQPLPTWTSSFVDALPGWFQTSSAAFMFAAELLAPFLIFGPRRARQIAAGVIALLQLLILATGNYGFFNWLSLLLCVLLLDDSSLDALTPWGWGRAGEQKRAAGWRLVPLALFAGSYLVASAAEMAARFWELPEGVERVLEAIRPFRSVNSYGLFAVMTHERPEIIVEGSDDGRTWRAYEFKWKPGRVDRAPRFVAPHQPRLDWQMWFAALGTCRRNPWFLQFQQRLLEGEPAVLGLLAANPFPGRPPRYVRSRLYQYRFAHRPGAWWERTEAGSYCPELTLREGVLAKP